MIFLESPRFPENISYGSSGGPMFSTDVVPLKSGHVSKNRNWSQALHRYDARRGIISPDDFIALKNFFMVMAGQYGSFRFKDWADYKSTDFNQGITALDQILAAPDGVEADFQLIKAYTSGALSHARLISKPVSGTTLISIDDVVFSGGWSVDTTSGIVTFDSGSYSVSNAADIGGGVTRITTGTNSYLETGESAFLSGFTDDWAALNGARYATTTVSASVFDIAFNSSTFAAYSSNGGQVDELPQTGEIVKAGFEFDVPVRCDADDMLSTWENFQIQSLDLPLIEERI